MAATLAGADATNSAASCGWQRVCTQRVAVEQHADATNSAASCGCQCVRLQCSLISTQIQQSELQLFVTQPRTSSRSADVQSVRNKASLEPEWHLMAVMLMP